MALYLEAAMALDDAQEAALRGELEDTKAALKSANKESQGHRLAADRANKAAEQAEAERDTAKADLVTQTEALRAETATKVAEAEASAAQIRTESSQRVLRAELRSQAVQAGMRDPDDLGALDTTAATIGDDGKVALPDGFFAKMKESKPYLFGAAVVTTTGNTAPVPSPAPGGIKQYKDMTPAEQASWKAANGIP